MASGFVASGDDHRAIAFIRDWSPLVDLGISGLNRTGDLRAIVEADWLPQLRSGHDYVLAMREIADNDPVAFAGLSAIDLLMRQTAWRVEPFSDKPEHLEQAEFLETVMRDMAIPWTEIVTEANSALWAGFSLLEMRFKRRRGALRDEVMSSDHDDNRWGIARLSPRAQHTIWYWVYDQEDNLIGARQLAPPRWRESVIPLSKCLHIVPRRKLGSAYGSSLLRGAFVPYFFLKRIREIEGIGITRDLAGLPVVKAPAELFADSATPQQKQTLQRLEALVQNIRRDTAEGVVLPRAYDPETKQELFTLELLSTGGSRQIGINETVTRYEQRIATSMLADFMMLGQGEGSGGSYALSADKSSLFKTALESYLDVIAEEFHRKAVRKLWKLNGWNPAEAPRWSPGAIGKRDLAALGGFLTALAGTGYPLWPDRELAEYVREVADLPKATDEQLDQMDAYTQAQQFQSLGLGPDGEPIEAPEPEPSAGPAGEEPPDGAPEPPAQEKTAEATPKRPKAA